MWQPSLKQPRNIHSYQVDIKNNKKATGTGNTAHITFKEDSNNQPRRESYDLSVKLGLPPISK